MPYTHHEDFGGAMQDRQISIFTTGNIIGAFLGAVIVWQLLQLLGIAGPLWLTYGLTLLLGGGGGIALTIRWDGMSSLDALVLYSGWRLRALLGQTTLHPQAAPAALDTDGGLSLYEGDEVLVRPYAPQEAARG
jgi:hypothetical protein